MSLLTITAADPAVLPVTLAEVKANSVVEHTDDDTLLEIILLAAIERVEKDTGKDLVSRSYRMSLDDFPRNGEIKLLRGPVIEVTAVKYFSASASPQFQTIASTVWSLDKGVRPNVVYLNYEQEWPVPNDVRGAVQVEYRSGYVDTSDSPIATSIPKTLKQAILMIADDTYRNRSEKDSIQLYVNPTVEHLLHLNRDYEI